MPAHQYVFHIYAYPLVHMCTHSANTCMYIHFACKCIRVFISCIYVYSLGIYVSRAYMYIPLARFCRVFRGVQPCGVRLRKTRFSRCLPHPNRSKQPRKDRQSSGFLPSEIWPQGCVKPDASNVLFESPLVPHSPVARFSLGATVPFFHFLSQPPVLWVFLRVACQDVCGVTLRKV